MSSETNMIAKRCKQCNEEFKVYPSLNRIVCCSISCSKKLQWKNKEYAEQMSLKHKGQKAWNKGLHYKVPNHKNKILNKLNPKHIVPHSTQTKEKLSEIKKKMYSEGKITPWCKGKENPYLKGNKNPNWKGGVSSANRIIRESIEYKNWRKSVFERDNWTCQECEKRGGELNVHHIKQFSEFPELRFDLNNGQTLCKECHDLTKDGGWEYRK